MQYTQLDFVPDPFDRRTPLKQAEWLLHELLDDRSHGFPCHCGACVYAAYRARGKGEGRAYSLRTLFMFFLWRGFLGITSNDTRLSRGGSFETYNEAAAKLNPAQRLALANKLHLEGQPQIFFWKPAVDKRAQSERDDILVGEGLLRYKDIWKLGKDRQRKIIKKLDQTYGADIFKKRVEEITRTRTLATLKKLQEREKTRRGKVFLRGILQKKCFYTYYKRAADRKLYDTVAGIRRELLDPRPAGPNPLPR
jgi:hypothetical protein